MAEGKVMKVRSMKGYPFVVIPTHLVIESGIKIGDYVWMEARPGMISIYPIQGFGRHGDKTDTHRQNQST